MKRIKELGVIAYEAKDLKGRQLENAINSFVQKCVEGTKSEEKCDGIYELSDEQIIEILNYNICLFDSVGNMLPIRFNVDVNGKHLFHIELTDHFISKVTLETI